MKILIRADASAEIGSGHLIRCRSLARSLRDVGADVRFCGRAPNGKFREDINREFRLYLLPLLGDFSVDPIDGRWLPVTEIKDSILTLNELKCDESWTPDWIVIDHYGLSRIWHRELRNAFPSVRLVVIDDLANRHIEPDLLVDHNLVSDDLRSRYRPWLPVDRQVRCCLGPDYALIDPLYSQLRSALPCRKRLRRLLLSLGGSGDVRLLEKILLALTDLPGLNLDIQLVQGGFASDSSLILDLCKKLDVQIIQSPQTLAPLMVSADASIGAGGTSTWERLCLGLPSIVFSVAENQEQYSKELGNRGFIEYLGKSEDFDTNQFQRAVLDWVHSPEELCRQSTVVKSLVDGFGCTRIARLMQAIFDPQYWQKLSFSPSETNSSLAWEDGLKLNVCLNAQSFPLSVIDYLQIGRHSLSPFYSFCSPLRESSPVPSDIRRVTVLSSPQSWMNEYIPNLIDNVLDLGCTMRWIHDHKHVIPGDVCFLLSYGRIISREVLALNRFNMVVHASALPKGKGWSPMTWQILDSSSSIPLTLFQAVSDLDAGPIYAQEIIQLRGNELAPEWQKIQALATIRLCTDWLKNYPDSATKPKPQIGDASIYPRRRPEDSCLDITNSLEESFPLLQVVDNDKYPAFFDFRGRRYRIRIDPYS